MSVIPDLIRNPVTCIYLDSSLRWNDKFTRLLRRLFNEFMIQDTSYPP